MSKIKVPQSISQIDEWSDASRYVAQTLNDLVQIINGGLLFSDNMSVRPVTVTFSGANSTLAVDHSLDRIPTGYLVIKKSAGIHVFDGSGTNTTKAIYLQASGAGTVDLYIF